MVCSLNIKDTLLNFRFRAISLLFKNQIDEDWYICGVKMKTVLPENLSDPRHSRF